MPLFYGRGKCAAEIVFYDHAVFLSYRVRQSVLERSEVPEDLRLLEPAWRGIRLLLGCCKVSSKSSPKNPPSPNHI